MPPVKLGIIGCGIAAKKIHWPALKELKDQFEITLICNHTEEKAKAFSQLTGNVPYVLDYRELLQSHDVEAVDIILPIDLNYQVTKEALQAGKHVMVEKPLAANLSEAKEMLSFERQFTQVKMVAENFRYHPIFYKAKSYMDEGKIGEPYGVVWDVFHFIDEVKNEYAQTKWRIDHKYPGGFITDGGIHNIAALRVLFGDIISGSAFTKSVNPKIGEVDTFSFQFLTPGNIHGVLNIFLSVNGFSQNQLYVFGKEGTILIKDLSEITLKTAKEELCENVKGSLGYKEEFEDFYTAIRTGKKITSSFEQAYRDLEVMLNALQSAERWPEFELN